MIKINKKVAFVILSILLLCIGLTINNITNKIDSDKISNWLTLLSLIISAYLMGKIIYTKPKE